MFEDNWFKNQEIIFKIKKRRLISNVDFKQIIAQI